MSGLADADFVTALVKTKDHLQERARKHARRHALRVPFSVGIELLFVAKKHGVAFMDFLGAASLRFDIDGIDLLLTAAEALDQEEVRTVFDAVHAAQALHDGERLHTTDRRLLDSSFPTQGW